MPSSIFTTITFSPVTEFIEKTRKLRDLYGSSFILSYLAEAVCRAAQEQLGPDAVVSPALLNTTMGTPDQIVIQGDFPEAAVQEAFGSAWGKILDACREWVCDNCHDWIETTRQKWVADGEWSSSRTLPWDRDWQHWKNYAWEVFWAQGASIPEALEALAHQERQERNWVGVNWVGESSTLSGVDAIAWPGLGRRISQKRPRQGETDRQIRKFFYELNLKIGEAILEDDLANYRKDPSARLRALAIRYDLDTGQSDLKHPDHQTLRQALAQKLGEAIITNREHLSILELTKRLFTLETVAKTLPHSEQLQKELPASFKEVNLWNTDQPMGWFRGDGDRAGEYVSQITRAENAGAEMKAFSTQMRKWGQSLKGDFEEKQGRIVFAGGDDFLGVFYPASKPTAAMDWLGKFKREVWHKDGNLMPITSSVGFVWASPQVPQRDVLQHCDAVERIAKDGGRDRLALRVLFNGGNYLDWVCPWDLLADGLLQGYCDRSGKTGLDANWTHFYNDVAVLEARHAFAGDQTDVAIALFGLYFPNFVDQVQHCDRWWNEDDSGRRVFSGILGDRKNYERQGDLDCAEVHSALNDWIINLAKVGFHLCSNT
jgi:CRISPR-associated protein Cmr2